MVNADNSVPANPAQPVAVVDNTTIKTVLPHEHEELEKQRHLHLVQFYFIKGVAILLALQGLKSLFNSIKFIFVELPALEQQLNLGFINQMNVNVFANKAIVMTISTILSLFFALRITITQSKVARRINTVIGLFLVLGNTQINNFLNQIGSSRLLTSMIVEALQSIFTH